MEPPSLNRAPSHHPILLCSAYRGEIAGTFYLDAPRSAFGVRSSQRGLSLGRSRLNLHTFAVNVIGADPSIDEPTVVANLVAAILNGLDEVQVFIARNLAQHDYAQLPTPQDRQARRCKVGRTRCGRTWIGRAARKETVSPVGSFWM